MDGLLPMREATTLVRRGTPGERFRLRMSEVCGDYARWVHRGLPGALDRPTCRGNVVQRWRIEAGGA